MTRKLMRGAALVQKAVSRACVRVPLLLGGGCTHTTHPTPGDYHRLFTTGVTSSIDLGREEAPGRLAGNGRSLVPDGFVV